jgi:hypothetical protein
MLLLIGVCSSEATGTSCVVSEIEVLFISARVPLFQINKSDPSLFLDRSSNAVVWLLVYVDDILITGSDSHLVASLIAQLNASFLLGDLGPMHYFMGIEAAHCSDSIHLSQTRYIHNIL